MSERRNLIQIMMAKDLLDNRMRQNRKMNAVHIGENKNKQRFYCEECGKEFERYLSKIKKWQSIEEFENLFCSRNCKQKWQKHGLIGARNPNWKGGPIRYECEVCGREFFVKRHNKEARFCSYLCYGKYKSKALKGRRVRLISAIQKQNLNLTGWGLDSYKNCIKFGTDDLKHFLAKSLVSWILSSRKRNFYTEMPLKNGVADVVDLDEKIIYEVENHYHAKRIEEKKKLLEGSPCKDIIIFDIGKYSNSEEDLLEMFKEFDRKIP